MSEANKIIQEEMQKHLLNYVTDMINNPKGITTIYKEDAVDLFDLYSDKELKAGVKVTEEEEKYAEENSVARELGQLTYGMEQSYVAFNYFVWKELSLKDKVLSVMWLELLLAKEDNKKPISFQIDFTLSEPLGYIYNEELQDYMLHINPVKLSSSEYLGYQIMGDVFNINMQDNLLIALEKYQTKKELKKFDKLTLINSIFRFEEPECYEKFLYKENLTKKEEQDLCIFAHQPMEQESRKTFERMSEYMTINQDILEVEDTLWEEHKKEILEEYKELDALYNKHYNKISKQELYERLFKPVINKFEEGFEQER